jgi:uncharacterized membrane protein
MAEEVKKEEKKEEEQAGKEEAVEKEVPKAEGSKNEVNTMALLAYLGPLCLVPLLTGEKDEFVKFHVKQGIVLLVIEAAIWAIWNFFLGSMVWSWSWGFYTTLANIQNFIWLGVGVLSVIGLLNVVNGQQKELPIVGKYSAKMKIVK